MFTVVGLLGMTGIIINDSIVLVTTIDEYAEDRGMIPAIVDGAADRLRPVVITALTTIVGLMPIALSKPTGEGFNFQGLAIGVAGGLAFTTFFTLWTVPLLYTLLRDLGEYFQRLFQRKGATVSP